MLGKFGDFITKWRWIVIAVWIVAAGVIINFSPKLSDVSSTDQSSFLPSHYQSIQAQNIQQKYFNTSSGASAIIVFKRADGQALTATDHAKISSVIAAVKSAHLPKVKGASTSNQMVSKDKKMQLGYVQYNGSAQDDSVVNAIKNLRSNVHGSLASSDLQAAVTGDAAIQLDTQDSSKNAEKIVSMVTILLILILPGFIFRSPLAALLPVLAVSLVFSIANSLLALAAQTFNFKVDGQLTTLLIVVLFGIGTDYILFLLFRYRERLRSGDHTRGAISFALARAGEPILSAALVVTAAFAALFAASLGFFSSLAPGLVISVLVMLLAALTLVPALVAVVGEKIFWPSKKWQSAPKEGTIAKKVGVFVSQKPGRVTSVLIIALLVLAAFVFQYKGTFDSISQLPTGAESTQGFKDLTASFAAGISSPTEVYAQTNHKLSTSEISNIRTKLSGAEGVSSVNPARMADGGKLAEFDVILKNSPASDSAIRNVKGSIRTAAANTSVDAHIVVGGETATYVDLQSAVNRDLRVVFPFAALLIFVILALLLRSLVAPFYLLGTVGLGFAATLGACVIAFITWGGNSGLNFIFPIFLYVFVVAVGTDYNILMITRLREEVRTEGNKPAKAAERAIEHSAATLASAGLILAGTFTSLTFTGLSMLTQIGVGVALGISIGAFVISMLLIPAISTLLGYNVWWPGHRPGKKN
ncbi:MAG: MMPL family transporter [Candidatus Saccharibacteria bacterium]